MIFENEAILKGIVVVHPHVLGDERGFFTDTYRRDIFSENGLHYDFVQEFYTGSTRGVVRGMHYQVPPFAQAKLIRILSGEVYDVVVDLRKKSESFGKWVGFLLSASNGAQLLIPEGFAHGFMVLSQWAEMQYKVSSYYHPASERTLKWNDPQIGIDWNSWASHAPIVSEKDENGKRLAEAEWFEEL